MGCDINKGRLTSCKDAIGGLYRVNFVNYESVEEWTIDADETVIGVVPTATAPITIYQYDLHLGNDLTQNIMSSPENGTLYFEQVLNLTLKKLSAEDNPQIKLLASGRPYIIVEDQMENIMLVGRVNGADVTGGTAVTGANFGDLNGYTLSFTAQERTLANFFNASLDINDPLIFSIVKGTVTP